jgi:hypothetical protein
MSLIFATQLTAIAATALALLALVTAVYAILDHAARRTRFAGQRENAKPGHLLAGLRVLGCVTTVGLVL